MVMSDGAIVFVCSSCAVQEEIACVVCLFSLLGFRKGILPFPVWKFTLEYLWHIYCSVCFDTLLKYSYISSLVCFSKDMGFQLHCVTKWSGTDGATFIVLRARFYNEYMIIRTWHHVSLVCACASMCVIEQFSVNNYLMSVPGIGTLLAVSILSIPQLGTKDVSKTLEWLFMTLLPNFCLGKGIMDFYSNFMFLSSCHQILPICPSVCVSMNITCCKGMISFIYLQRYWS